MDPKGRLSSQIHFLVPLGITYSDTTLWKYFRSDLIMECIRHAYETTIKIESEDR